MIEGFIKLNKYQKGMIISLLILSLSLIGFMFNSRVKLSEPQDEIPDIIIEDPIDIDPEDKESYIISKDNLFKLMIMILLPLVIFKVWGIVNDI